ncbi:MAG: ribosome small subunit-dependent GTPase A [Gemmatimonadales bacterium]|nr:ribosome small subunit-dependent GTPase A [Gemmatimonadales bacterium]
MSAPLEGTVLERDGATYRVAVGGGEVRAVLRKKAKRGEERVVVGDDVALEPEAQGGLHAIVSVQPRRSLLERRVPEGRGARPVVANADRVAVVTAPRDPLPVLQLLDRLLVVAAVNEIEAEVVVNKADLDPEGAAALATRFGRAGYVVRQTSAKRGIGVDDFRADLAGRVTVVTGPSGVGKSSLLNAIQPGLALRTQEVSARVGRGRHTTVGALMVPLVAGGYIVDTPGFSEVGLWGVAPRELARCFPEFVPLLEQCRFADCTHLREPGCRVLAAVQAGSVSADRHESYVVLAAELEAEPEAWE